MPELPEVETIRRDLAGEIVGATIMGITSSWPKKVLPSLEQIQEHTVGKEIVSVSRVGKVLSIDLDDASHLLIHLKLSGQVLLRPAGTDDDPYVRHTIFLSGGREIRFADMRKFGYVRLVDEDEWHEFCTGFGPEPAPSDEVITHLMEVIERRRVAIKSILLEQTVLAGVGNIYANDALFLSRIHPARPGHSLSRDEAALLLESLEAVLTEGLRLRGASDNTYRDARGQKGGYQDHFKVYGRTGEPCLHGCGTLIQYEKVGGRGTFFCNTCQV